MQLYYDVLNMQQMLFEEEYRERKSPVCISNPSNPQLVIVLPAGTARLPWSFSELPVPTKVLRSSVYRRKDRPRCRTIVDFYKENSIDYKQYIPPGLPVLVVGNALFSFVKTKAFSSWSEFTDHLGVYGNRFYYPPTKSWVYPIPSAHEIKKSDSFASAWAKVQLEYALAYKDEQAYYLDTSSVKTQEISSPSALYGLLRQYRQVPEFSLDLETTGLDPWEPGAKIVCLSVAFDSKIGYVIPWDCVESIKDAFVDFLRGKDLIGTNIKFDARWLVVVGKIPRDVISFSWDIMQSAHVLDETSGNGLKAQAWRYTNLGGYDEALDDFKRKYKISGYHDIPKNILYEYAALDAVVTYRVYRAHKQILLNWGIKSPFGWTPIDYFKKIVMPSVNIYLDFELDGVYFDWDRLQSLGFSLEEKIRLAKQDLLCALGNPDINIDSPEQLGAYIEKKLKWPLYERSKKGFYKVNKTAMLFWSRKSPEAKLIVQKYLQYRRLKDLQKTFVGDPEKKTNGFWQYRKPDGRLHSSYAVMLARSGRNRSSNPNLQNIGNTPDFEEFKACFLTPSSEYYLVEFDAAGLQLRQGAIASKDSAMMSAFLQGQDLHAKTAWSVLFNDQKNVSFSEFLRRISENEKGPEASLRKKAKSVNFSLLFGASAFAFAKNSISQVWSVQESMAYVKENNLEDQRLFYKKVYAEKFPDLSENDIEDFSYFWTVAKHIRDKFFETYPGLARWHEKVISTSSKRGYVVSYYGAVRRVLPLYKDFAASLDKKQRKHWQNVAINSPIQNWEACYMNESLIKAVLLLKQRKMKSRFFGNIHDAFLCYVHKDEMEQFKEIIKETFHDMRPMNRGIPFITEGVYCDPRNGGIWSFKEHPYY